MSPLDNLIAWEALVVASKTGSITRTAFVLDMEITRVSRLLADLEKTLGFECFDKTRRPMRPTPECLRLVRKVEPLVNGFRTLRAGGDEGEHRNETFRIRFSAPEELTRDFFADHLCTYSTDHPDTIFTLMGEIRPEELHKREVDVAVVNHLPIDDSGLMFRHLHTSSTVPLTTPEYLEQHGTPDTIDDLSDHIGLIHHSVNVRDTTVLHRNGIASAPIQWRDAFFASDQAALKRLLLNHRGITVDLFLGHVVEEIRAGRVVPILRGWERAPWQMCVVTRTEDEERSPRLRAFAEWFTGYAGNALRIRTRDGWRSLNRSSRQSARPEEGNPEE